MKKIITVDGPAGSGKEKISNMISNLSTQVGRGSFSYAQLMIIPITG